MRGCLISWRVSMEGGGLDGREQSGFEEAYGWKGRNNSVALRLKEAKLYQAYLFTFPIPHFSYVDNLLRWLGWGRNLFICLAMAAQNVEVIFIHIYTTHSSFVYVAIYLTLLIINFFNYIISIIYFAFYLSHAQVLFSDHLV